MVLMTSVAFLTLIGSVLAASRITWSFARDEALVFSRFVKMINPKQGVPIFALCFNAFWISAIGCIYLGSTTGSYYSLPPYGWVQGWNATESSFQHYCQRWSAGRADFICLSSSTSLMATAKRSLSTAEEPLQYGNRRLVCKLDCGCLDMPCASHIQLPYCETGDRPEHEWVDEKNISVSYLNRAKKLIGAHWTCQTTLVQCW